MSLDSSLPARDKRALSDNARAILKHLVASADRNGHVDARVATLCEIGMCNRKAAYSVIIELTADGALSLVRWVGDDRVECQVTDQGI